jgi:hypothetical protein
MEYIISGDPGTYLNVDIHWSVSGKLVAQDGSNLDVAVNACSELSTASVSLLEIAIQFLRFMLERTSSKSHRSKAGQGARPRPASTRAVKSRHHVRRRVRRRGSNCTASTFSVPIVPSTSAAISTRTEIVGRFSRWAARGKSHYSFLRLSSSRYSSTSRKFTIICSGAR